MSYTFKAKGARMSQVEWYYARENKQTGPVSAVELKRLATAGELRPDDLVWREGMTEWSWRRTSAACSRTTASRREIGDLPRRRSAPARRERRRRNVRNAAACHWLSQCHTGRRRGGPAGASFSRRAPGWAPAPVRRPVHRGTAKVFWACGFFGLFAGMVLVACCVAFCWRGHWVVAIWWAFNGCWRWRCCSSLRRSFRDALERLFRKAFGAWRRAYSRLLCTCKRACRSRGFARSNHPPPERRFTNRS